MNEPESRTGIKARGEEALGDLAQALLDNPLLSQALSRTLGAGERAVRAQRSAVGALDLALSSDLERIERRLRSLSDRIEEVEDRLDELGAEVSSLRRPDPGPGPVP